MAAGNWNSYKRTETLKKHKPFSLICQLLMCDCDQQVFISLLHGWTFLCNHVYEKHIEEAGSRARACAPVFAQRGERLFNSETIYPIWSWLKPSCLPAPSPPPPPLSSHEKCVLYNQEQRKRKLITHTSSVTCGIPPFLSIWSCTPEANNGLVNWDLICPQNIDVYSLIVFLCASMQRGQTPSLFWPALTQWTRRWTTAAPRHSSAKWGAT